MRTVAMALAVFGLAGPALAAGMLKSGNAFPAWTLRDQAGQEVSSAQLAGTTYLLWFFPKALSPGCTKEGCTLRDNYAGFQKAGVQVLGVSFDTPASNARFVAKDHFPFRLLSDTDKKLAVEVGAADSTHRLWARRISYLVGPDGKVLEAYPDVSPAKHATQVLADLARLQSRQ